MSCLISSAAREGIAATIRFYNRKPGRYGAAFRSEFGRAVASISANPRMYPQVEDGIPGREIREYFIARFRQRVIYALNGDDILVVAVIHTDAREGAWHRNLPPTLPETT